MVHLVFSAVHNNCRESKNEHVWLLSVAVICAGSESSLSQIITTDNGFESSLIVDYKES